MQTVANVIDAFGGPKDFAAIINKQRSTASEQKRNGSIPGRYWLTIVRAAEERGIEGVTLESLAHIHADPPPPPEEDDEPEKEDEIALAWADACNDIMRDDSANKNVLRGLSPELAAIAFEIAVCAGVSLADVLTEAARDGLRAIKPRWERMRDQRWEQMRDQRGETQ